VKEGVPVSSHLHVFAWAFPQMASPSAGNFPCVSSPDFREGRDYGRSGQRPHNLLSDSRALQQLCLTSWVIILGGSGVCSVITAMTDYGQAMACALPGAGRTKPKQAVASSSWTGSSQSFLA
jgi:hypothetical protein